MNRIFAGMICIGSLASCFLDSPIKRRESPDELQYNYWLLQKLYYHPEQLQSLDLFYEKADSMQEAGYVATVELDGLSERQFFATVRLYQSLPDPYTRYVPPERVDGQKQHDTSTVIQGGLGIEFVEKGSESDCARLEVLRVYPESPADSAGLRPGDRFFAMNGFSLCNDSANARFSAVMRDSAWIRPDILRLDSGEVDTLHFDILRGTVYVPTVFVDSVEGISVLELRQFMRTSVRDGGSIDEFRKALQNTQGGGTRVLDLRGNPGGEVRVCLDMADEFVDHSPMIHLINHTFNPRGNAVVDTVTYWGTPGGVAAGDAVVIAMDSRTASCAEIFIAALKGSLGDKVTLVGTHSYGKAIGQSRWDTPAKGLAIITSLQIRTPGWVDYQGVGILPDVEVASDDILTEAIGLAQERSGLARKTNPSAFRSKQLIFLSETDPYPPSPGAWVDSTEILP